MEHLLELREEFLYALFVIDSKATILLASFMGVIGDAIGCTPRQYAVFARLLRQLVLNDTFRGDTLFNMLDYF